MRLDKFINTVNLTKRRSLAKDMCDNQSVLVNGVVAKGAKDIKVGDVITLVFLDSKASYKVLLLPTTKSTKKDERDKYVESL
ncbi:hypothetical protein BKH43_02765 [Helicobacter sp. 13S00401-1]|uniref:S4 domain-containing protein n=1 Tax=Helicobacter sp. 13S00401-1 TaxID=1905758 RepID=UPI000BA67FE4|nr:S4 domain-containing protein [Helicobacter sp. 13S00401-1]PAF51144.1 hypothetical protein BKH43_02765 [Helicobacter sp. 13S00401-1]